MAVTGYFSTQKSDSFSNKQKQYVQRQYKKQQINSFMAEIPII